MYIPSYIHIHTHTPSSRTRGRQEEVFNQARRDSILLMKVSASIDKVDFMALSLHVPARSAPVAGAWFKRNVRPQPCALSVSPLARSHSHSRHALCCRCCCYCMQQILARPIQMLSPCKRFANSEQDSASRRCIAMSDAAPNSQFCANRVAPRRLSRRTVYRAAPSIAPRRPFSPQQIAPNASIRHRLLVLRRRTK